VHAAVFALVSAVTATKDVAYAPDVPGEKHRLDIYAPAGVHKAPVLVFIHGGGFEQGDRRDYDGLGTALAYHGVVVVIPSYRLYPQTDARGAAADVAAAVAWAAKHIAGYGGNPRSIVLSGHSAGGYLAALVGLDGEYLKAAGISASVVRGVIGFSGTYDVRELDPDATPDDRKQLQLYFGASEDARALVSPITYAGKEAPPLELFCGGVYDAVACGQRDRFFAALVDAGAVAQIDADETATHVGVAVKLSRPGTLEQNIVLDFFAKNAP